MNEYNPALTGPVEGTTIASLYQKKLNSQYSNTSNIPNIQNTQNIPNNYNNYYNNATHQQPHHPYQQDISYIVDDIKQTIKKEDKTYKKNKHGDYSDEDDEDDDSHDSRDDDDDDDDDYNGDGDDDDLIEGNLNRYYNKNKTKTKNTKSTKSKYINFIKELSLLWIIYMIMSQKFIINFIGERINLILPNENGDVSILGKGIYGSILCIIFFIFRYIFIKY
jgi:hypothetical protein